MCSCAGSVRRRAAGSWRCRARRSREGRVRDHMTTTAGITRRWPWLFLLALLACGGYWLHGRSATRDPAGPEQPARAGTPAVPVVAADGREGDMPVYLRGLGSVAAFNTVTVRSRVDGQV